jgi:DNA-binding LacI/PurR family transcriptional regulator
MAVTIRDIAKVSGRSIGTVSRALKNQGGLTEQTRAEICAAARKLGYDTGQLRQGRIRRIAFLLHRQHNTLASSPFFSPVLHGAEEACRREGIALSFFAVGPADPVLDQIRRHQPDAILCAGFFEPELLDALRNTGKPVVLIDMSRHGFSSVNPDHHLGAFLATRHLIRAGRKRIAMLSGSLAHHSIQERARGYRKALFEARMLADPDLEVTAAGHAGLEEGARSAVQQLLALPQRPDALFCFNDASALAALRVCLDAGLKVSHDIAIIGFDDISAAAMASPPLSSIHVDKEGLGAAGVELLLRKPGSDTVEQLLPVELLVRESSNDD